MNLVSVIKSVFQTKFMEVRRKLRMLLNPTAMRSQVLVKVRKLFMKLLDFRPEDQNDYYALGNWMISRRFVHAVVIFAGILSICYLIAVRPVSSASAGDYKTYRYGAAALKFYNGKVRILGKSGYTAYIGEVMDGAVTGSGRLYNKNGEIVYEGEFSENKYNGNGKKYEPGNVLRYEGSFQDNEFMGEGLLYYGNGAKEYEGGFSEGKKEGEGTLYDSSGNLVYSGRFQNDHVILEELLGKTTEEVSKRYMGEKTIYQSDNDFSVVMNDIAAVYYGISGEDSLQGEWTVGGVYSLNDYFPAGRNTLTTIGELTEWFGAPVYEGNTVLYMTDAVAVNQISKKRDIFNGTVGMETTAELEDVITVESWDKNYFAYIYRFEKDGVQYTFFCKDRNQGFELYLVEQAE